MGGGVDTQRQPAHNRDPGVDQRRNQRIRHVAPVNGGAARADKRYCPAVLVEQRAFDVEHGGRFGQLGQ